MVVLSRTLKPAAYWWTTVVAVTLTAAFIVVWQAWQWRTHVARSGATLGRKVDTSRS